MYSNILVPISFEEDRDAAGAIDTRSGCPDPTSAAKSARTRSAGSKKSRPSRSVGLREATMAFMPASSTARGVGDM